MSVEFKPISEADITYSSARPLGDAEFSPDSLNMSVTEQAVIDLISAELPDVEIAADKQSAFENIAFLVKGPSYLIEPAKQYASWIQEKKSLGEHNSHDLVESPECMAYALLCDIHKSKFFYGDYSPEIEKLRTGNEHFQYFDNVYATLAPQIKEDLHERIPKWSPSKKLSFFVQAKKVIANSPEAEQEEIYSQLGYSNEKLKEVMSSIAKSTAVDIPLSLSYESIGVAAGGAAIAMGVGNDWKTAGISLGLYWAALIANGIPNTMWMRNKKIGWCPNGAAAVGYHLVSALVPDNKAWQYAVTTFAGLVPDAVKDIGWLSAGGVNQAFLSGGNAAGVGLNVSQAITMVYLNQHPEKVENTEKYVGNIGRTALYPLFEAGKSIKNKLSDTRENLL
jgi:hypothetical protein